MPERPGFRSGLGALFNGYGYLFRSPDIWPLALVPILIALILWGILGSLLVKGGLALVDAWIDPNAGSMYMVIVVVVLQVLAGLLGLGVAFVLAFALAKPLSGSALERIVQRLCTEQGVPVLQKPTFAKDLIRSLQSSLVAIVFVLPILVGLMAVSLFIPVATVITTPVEFVVTAIVVAWDFCDYPLSMRNLPVSERIEFVRRNFNAVFGFGVGFGLLLLVPCSLLIVLPAGVIGATQLTIAIEKWEAAAKERAA